MFDSGILSGVKVLALEQQVAGPYCTMMLADQGADIIKVERPGVGDSAREMAPIVKNDKGEIESGFFTRFNRSKRSITLDLRSKEGIEVLWDLAKQADIIVDNQKPGSFDKIGFTYDKIKEVNPRVVYTAISGFGRLKKYEGPFSARLSYDIISQGMAGLMHTCGSAQDGPPTWLGFALGDTGTGVFAAYASLLGYINCLKTGHGEFIDVSMYDCMIALAERSHNIYALTGTVVGRGPDTLIAPWGPFPCKDGYVALIVPTVSNWQKFTIALGRPDLFERPELKTGPGRAEHMDELGSIMFEWMKDKTKIEICDLLMSQGLPCGPIQTSEEVAHCPHIAKRDLLVKVNDPILGEMTVVGNPLKMDNHSTEYTAFPKLGEHTDDILSALGYDEAKIKALHDVKAV